MSCPHQRGIFAIRCGDTLIGCDGHCWQHCPAGVVFSNRLLALHNNGLSHTQITSGYHDIMDEWLTHGVIEHNMPDTRVQTTHQGNGAYQGVFAFTLTKSPTDDLTVNDMITAVKKVMNQKSIPTKKFAWYLEYGDEETQSHPHIHGLYETETGNRIESKHFKRAWKIWDPKQKQGAGFRGGYHRPVRDNESYNDYIAKDGGIGERFNC